ncbi:MAG TPA: universal stress protein [Gemmatimonadaceae bacterium]
MITATETPEAGLQSVVNDATTLGPILVATDGTASAEAALRAASMLERHTGAEVVVLAVLEGLPLVAADYGMLIPPIDSDESRRLALKERVRAQVEQANTLGSKWKVEVRDGDPPATIARAARELKARLIVVGLGHHELLDRLFGGETALHALRVARAPVLAVPPDFAHLPRRVVVATDFSVASVKAARKAFALIDTATMVYLVHVAPRLELQPEAFAAWMSLFGEGVGPAFGRVEAELGLPATVPVETVARNGKPSREILEFARSTQADLIVTGSRGAGLVDRILVGSTATGILRGAQCAVLAVPVGPGDRQLTWPPSADRARIATADWAGELEAFTKRNIGRLASLEVDDPELGAQAQEHDYPFLGAAWDHHDERVEIMLGDFEGTGRHLTRGIGGVTGIDILRDEKGRDWILRIMHGAGQTILALAR